MCGKITRELIKESIEVYPIPGYGAIEIGRHRFHNNQDLATYQKMATGFIIIWKKEGKNGLLYGLSAYIKH